MIGLVFVKEEDFGLNQKAKDKNNKLKDIILREVPKIGLIVIL